MLESFKTKKVLKKYLILPYSTVCLCQLRGRLKAVSAFLVTPPLIGLKPTAKAGKRTFVQTVAGTLKTGEVRLMMRLNNGENPDTVAFCTRQSVLSIVLL